MGGDNVKNFWEKNYKDGKMGGRLTNSTKLKKHRFKNEIRFIEKNIDKYYHEKNDINLLDLGCGEGDIANYFYHKGYNVTGVDISHSQIQKNKNRNNNINFISGDITDTSLYDNKKYDIIYIGGVMMYLNDEKVIRLLNFLINNLVKKNGLIIFRESLLVNGENNLLHMDKYPVYYRNIKFYPNLFDIIHKEYNWSYITGYAYSKLPSLLYYFLFPLIILRLFVLIKIFNRQNKIQIFFIIKK